MAPARPQPPVNTPTPNAARLGDTPTHTRTQTDDCRQLGGCIVNSAIPDWCAYCGRPIRDWVTARREVIVQAAERARRQRQARRQREERLDAAARRVNTLATWRRIDAMIARTTTWADIMRKFTVS